MRLHDRFRRAGAHRILFTLRIRLLENWFPPFRHMR
jgi:hypothetical protein